MLDLSTVLTLVVLAGLALVAWLIVPSKREPRDKPKPDERHADVDTSVHGFWKRRG